jgi:hypothetical protein
VVEEEEGEGEKRKKTFRFCLMNEHHQLIQFVPHSLPNGIFLRKDGKHFYNNSNSKSCPNFDCSEYLLETLFKFATPM